MQPDDLSLPRADSKIKEKLNLHVKKRLLQDPANTSKISPSTCPAVIPPPPAAAAAAPPPPSPKTKKQKTKHSSPQTPSGQPVQLTIGTLGSLSNSRQAAENLLLSPGGGGNSNDSSFNSVEADPDASNDGQSAAGAGTSNGEKTGKAAAATSKPDIFTMILNEKKASLMRDPEVIKFLNDIVKERNKS